MKSICFFIIVIMLIFSNQVKSQNIIIQERTTPNYHEYFIQTNLVYFSLVGDTLSKSIRVSDSYNFTETDLHQMSEEFNTALPKDYTKQIASFIDIKPKVNKGLYAKWIYGKILEDEIIPFVELYIYFETDKSKPDGIKYPKISNIQIRTNNLKKIKIDTEIRKKYQEHLKNIESAPPFSN
ncbi:MAG: hypothetical protein LPK19_05240 [Hymenobacteraceae bacterium]|nr:hypothetical protein [Hymenobacteraceae bacterium]MDX5511655.1 hypothetical protein [Hymenobacteraceae bacterium]